MKGARYEVKDVPRRAGVGHASVVQRIRNRPHLRQAKAIKLIADIEVVVDHIYPINGDTVSGLHVPANLQILTTRENCRKSRRLPGTRSEELWEGTSSWTPMRVPEVDAVILKGVLARGL